MLFRLSRMLDVSQGVQPDQFSVGGREEIDSLADLDPEYLQLLVELVTAVLAVIGGDGRPNLTRCGSGMRGSRDHELRGASQEDEWVRGAQ